MPKRRVDGVDDTDVENIKTEQEEESVPDDPHGPVGL